MSRKTKWGIGVVSLVLLGTCVGITASKRGNKATEVRIEDVARRDLVASVTASGQVEPRTKVDLTADISGRIVRLAVKEGQMVSRGQFLLEIDPVQYQAGVQRAEAGLAAARAQEAQARANLEQARSNLARSEEIRKANPTLVSAEQVEQLKTALEVNEALYQSARHNVEQSAATLRDARSSLAKTVISAPMAGRITRLNVELGETAVPGTFNMDAATLLTIADMSVLETKIKVDETDVARISLGDSAMVEIDAFPDTSFVGRVVEISNSSIKLAGGGPQGQDQAVDYEVTVQLLDPPSETRPDFSATAKIVTDTRKNALSVPIIALTVREHETSKSSDSAAIALGRQPSKQVGQRDVEGVFIVGADNKVTFRPVRVGIAGEEYFEVVDGLQPGEKIVAGSYQAIRELRDGAAVREAEQPEGTPAPGAST
ncbi:MAG: efflux RND transporter periplasmic adaptor subunit [Gemmatimonadaceae bacterium]